jgi:hypothetical protein
MAVRFLEFLSLWLTGQLAKRREQRKARGACAIITQHSHCHRPAPIVIARLDRAIQ